MLQITFRSYRTTDLWDGRRPWILLNTCCSSRGSIKLRSSVWAVLARPRFALQFAYWTKEKKPEYSIFWVSALNNESFDQSYSEIARILSIRNGAKDEDLKESVRRHLSSTNAGPWLLIVDNADDRDALFGPPDGLGINDYSRKASTHDPIHDTHARSGQGCCGLQRGGASRDEPPRGSQSPREVADSEGVDSRRH